MFTGIIESIGEVLSVNEEDGNKRIVVRSDIARELKIDQSVAHNGVCLTVTRCDNETYDVVMIAETLMKSNLGNLVTGDKINLERSMKLGDRLDGHMVQGHVDQTAECVSIEDQKGSFKFTFRYSNLAVNNITVEKGSITINGVSLTVFESSRDSFSVAIIPYTYENTTFNTINVGDKVNLEFDIIGKYVQRIYDQRT